MKMARRVGILLAAFTIAAGTVRAGEELPRYKLEPGMELVYKGSDRFKHQNGSHVSDMETTAWIVRRNGDGSVRVVLRQGSRFKQTFGAESLKASLKSLLKKQEPLEYQLGYFDLFPDGRIGTDAELGYQIDPATLFPRLPSDETQAKTVWGQNDGQMGKAYQYSALKADQGGWVFHSDRLGPEKKIYGMILESIFHFDTARGAIKRIEQNTAQDYGFKGKGTGTVELTSVEKKDATWLATFASAADRYFAANKAYEAASEVASKDAVRAKPLLLEAKAKLQAARDSTEQPIFREQLDRQLAKHETTATYYVGSAQRRADVVGKPAADWSLQDLDGKTHALADLRGQVVVLDFWYRGCGWCIKAMPQMNALAEQFKGRPVTILGMNTDSDLADAKFVVDAMGLKYETLRAKGIPEKYGVQGFPTLIIVDREGKVSDVHVGYSPTLQVEVAKGIEGLLKPETKVKP